MLTITILSLFFYLGHTILQQKFHVIFRKKGNIDGCSDFPINFTIGAERVTSRNQRPTKGPKEL